jgi:threonylcarbamoyladenosine tRNA methylthiotransferase MtaB
MVKDGVREIVLTGINLGEYGRMTNEQFSMTNKIPMTKSQISLPKLIEEIAKIDGLLRIRLSSIEPMYITDDLIKVVKDNPKVCKHLHIPLQSGDDKILKAMNRNYTSKDFLNLIKKIKKQIKDIAITTDIIIGFPGEDDKAFKNTCRLAKQARFSRIHIFSYSDRPGTAASKLPDKIDPKTIAKRREKLEEIRDRLMLKFHRSFRKRPVEVLIEQKDMKTGMYEGLSGGFIRIFMDGDDMGDEYLGRLIPVKFREFEGENVIADPILV